LKSQLAICLRASVNFEPDIYPGFIKKTPFDYEFDGINVLFYLYLQVSLRSGTPDIFPEIFQILDTILHN
jgi:hypothetical protein